MHKWISPLVVFSFLTLSGCSRYYIAMEKDRLDASHLASTVVNTPDPRQDDPPHGERLIAEWHIPTSLMKKNPKILLDVLYYDYTEETKEIPITRNLGYAVYDLVGDRFEKKKGIIAYKADIIDEDGVIYKSWKHQMWVKLIQVQEDTVGIQEELDSGRSDELSEDELDDIW